MKLTICDYCGKRFEGEADNYIHFVARLNLPERYELCEDCASKIKTDLDLHIEAVRGSIEEE